MHVAFIFLTLAIKLPWRCGVTGWQPFYKWTLFSWKYKRSLLGKIALVNFTDWAFFWISSTLLLCVRRHLSFAGWFWPLRAALGPAGMQMSPDKGDGEAKRGGSRELELFLVICRAIKQCPKNVPLSFLFPPLPLFFTALEQHLLHVWWAGGAVRALEYKIFFFARPLENTRPSQNNSLQPTV